MGRIYAQILMPSADPLLYFDDTPVEEGLAAQIPACFDAGPIEWPESLSGPAAGDFLDLALLLAGRPYLFRCKVRDRIWTVPAEDGSGSYAAEFMLTLILELHRLNAL